MATSGTTTFESGLSIDDIIEEAYNRLGLDSVSGYQLKSARRSLNIMFQEWANRGLNQWTIAQKTVAMVKDDGEYNIDSTNATAPIDVLDAFVRETIGSEITDLPLTKLSRAEYAHIATKGTTGKPSQIFVNRQISPTITVWPVPDKSDTYTVYMNVLTRMDDAGAATNTLDMPFRFYPCLAAGLAYYLSMKRAPDKTAFLKQIYDEEFIRALSTDQERASFYVSPNFRGYNTA